VETDISPGRVKPSVLWGRFLKKESACLCVVCILLTTLSFIRKIKRGEKIYLAEVESKRINGRVVQRFIRHGGREAEAAAQKAEPLSRGCAAGT
jgi:hypothetical protein